MLTRETLLRMKDGYPDGLKRDDPPLSREEERAVVETALSLYDEVERLKKLVCEPIDFACWKRQIEIEGENLMRAYGDVIAENDRLQEQLRLTHIDCCNEMAENAALREVVEAAKELMLWDNNALDTSGRDCVTGEPVPVACEEYRAVVSNVLAALKRLEEK